MSTHNIAPIPRSGIVLYPADVLTPALARQVGMVLGAETVNDDVQLGTAYAAGYREGLTNEILDLRNPGIPLSKAERVTEQTLFSEFGSAIELELGLDLVAKGLGQAIAMRRLDVILPEPTDRPYSHDKLLVLAVGVRTLAGYRYPPATLQFWQGSRKGTVTCLQPRSSIDQGHPLYHAGTGGLSITRHVIETSAVTLQPIVEQHITYEPEISDPNIEKIAPGFQLTSRFRPPTYLSATYDIPTSSNPDTAEKLAALDTENERRKQAFAERIREPNSDQALVGSGLGDQFTGYNDTTRITRAELARLLDPQDNYAWSSRLN